MKARTFLRVMVLFGTALFSACAGFPARHVDTVLRGAVAADLALRSGK